MEQYRSIFQRDWSSLGFCHGSIRFISKSDESMVARQRLISIKFLLLKLFPCIQTRSASLAKPFTDNTKARNTIQSVTTDLAPRDQSSFLAILPSTRSCRLSYHRTATSRTCNDCFDHTTGIVFNEKLSSFLPAVSFAVSLWWRF